MANQLELSKVFTLFAAIHLLRVTHSDKEDASEKPDLQSFVYAKNLEETTVDRYLITAKKLADALRVKQTTQLKTTAEDRYFINAEEEDLKTKQMTIEPPLATTVFGFRKESVVLNENEEDDEGRVDGYLMIEE